MTDNLYVRVDSEEDQGSNASNTPKKSTSLSSLRNLRDSFKRSDSTSSQFSLANNGANVDDETHTQQKSG